MHRRIVRKLFTLRSTLSLIVPLEMVKCNQQINFQGKTKKENRFFKKTLHIYRKTGIRGFYRGFIATANRDVISTGLYFCIYYSIRNKYKESHGKILGSAIEVFAGIITGLITWTVQYPFDTIKTIIQTSPIKERPVTQKEVFINLKSQGGVRQVYRGALPSLLLSVIFTSSNFLFFEFFKGILKPEV